LGANVPSRFSFLYNNSYYLERLARLEAALARKPRELQIEM